MFVTSESIELSRSAENQLATLVIKHPDDVRSDAIAVGKTTPPEVLHTALRLLEALMFPDVGSPCSWDPGELVALEAEVPWDTEVDA